MSCESFSSPLFTDNFHDAFFQQRQVRNDGVDSVCQNSFLRRGRVFSILCILFRSSMTLIIDLLRLLEICNCFCFVRIVVDEQDCMSFFFTFFSFCHQFSFCHGILILYLTHIRQQSMCTLLLYIVCVLPCCVSLFLCVTHSSVCITSLCGATSRNSSVY